MLVRKPFMKALLYLPLNKVDVQSLMRDLRIRFITDNVTEDYYLEEGEVKQENGELICYDLSRPGYIGVPRQYGMERLNFPKFIDLTTPLKKTPEKFLKQIKPRDDAQRDFMETLGSLVSGPKPVDIIANARTGTGKTVAALWLIENHLQSPTLICVPTTYLLNQWRKRISQLMGQHWCDLYVGHVQQNRMDYRGRLITLGVNASLARRDYPVELREYFSVVILDEFHKIPTPTISGILAKYPASVRIGMTATNRRDALARVGRLHMGNPRVRSNQEVMRPNVYVVDHTMTLPRRMRVFNERHMTSVLAASHGRNRLLCNIIADGYGRGRNVVALSDRTDQLQWMREYLIGQLNIPAFDVGLLVAQYKEGERKVRTTKDEQEWISNNCRIALATYGLVDTGADVERWDMGVECTPRINLRQAIGRILRIKPDKPIPEWYSIADRIMLFPDGAPAGLFSDPTPQIYQPLLRWTEARLASYADQRGSVIQLGAYNGY